MGLRRLTVALVTCSALAIAADPFVGKWKLNAEKGQSQNVGKPKSATMSIEQQGDGLKVIYESVEADGKPYKSTMTYVFDGKDHPYQDPDGVCETLSARRVDAKNIAVTCKGKGQPILDSTLKLSEDGKELTGIQSGTISGTPIKTVLVFERQ